jgi:hypothetical protein
MPVVGQVRVMDASRGWTIGGGANWTTNLLLPTEDGGSTWSYVNLGLPEPYRGNDFEYMNPVLLSPQSAALPVRIYRYGNGLFCATQNAADVAWSLTATFEAPDLSSTGHGSSIPWSAVDESPWFVAGSEAAQYLTRDRGQTWEVFPANGLHGIGLVEVQFASPTDGCGLGRICVWDVACGMCTAGIRYSRRWAHVDAAGSGALRPRRDSGRRFVLDGARVAPLLVSARATMPVASASDLRGWEPTDGSAKACAHLWQSDQCVVLAGGAGVHILWPQVVVPVRNLFVKAGFLQPLRDALVLRRQSGMPEVRNEDGSQPPTGPTFVGPLDCGELRRRLPRTKPDRHRE